MFPRQSTLLSRELRKRGRDEIIMNKLSIFHYTESENFFNFSFSTAIQLFSPPAYVQAMNAILEWKDKAETFRLFLMSRKLYFLFVRIVARRCRHLTTHFTVSWTEFLVSSTEEFNFSQLTVGQDKLWKTKIPFNSSLKFAVFVIHLLWCTRIFACKHQHDITCRASMSSPKKKDDSIHAQLKELLIQH